MSLLSVFLLERSEDTGYDCDACVYGPLTTSTAPVSSNVAGPSVSHPGNISPVALSVLGFMLGGVAAGVVFALIIISIRYYKRRKFSDQYRARVLDQIRLENLGADNPLNETEIRSAVESRLRIVYARHRATLHGRAFPPQGRGDALLRGVLGVFGRGGDSARSDGRGRNVRNTTTIVTVREVQEGAEEIEMT